MSDCSCSPEMTFSVGFSYPITVALVNPATGQPYEPTSIFAWVKSSTGAITMLPTPTETAAGSGAYTTDWRPAANGTWLVFMSDANNDPTAANFTVWQRVNVRPLP